MVVEVEAAIDGDAVGQRPGRGLDGRADLRGAGIGRGRCRRPHHGQRVRGALVAPHERAGDAGHEQSDDGEGDEWTALDLRLPPGPFEGDDVVDIGDSGARRSADTRRVGPVGELLVDLEPTGGGHLLAALRADVHRRSIGTARGPRKGESPQVRKWAVRSSRPVAHVGSARSRRPGPRPSPARCRRCRRPRRSSPRGGGRTRTRRRRSRRPR